MVPSLVLIFGIAYTFLAIVSFKHATLMTFIYGFLAILCFASFWLFSLQSPFAWPSALVNVILLVLIVASVLYVQKPALRCKTPHTVRWIVVLGCRLINGKPGRTLTRRLETALQCYRQHPEAQIMVCGGKGDDELLSEADAMSAYLVAQGVLPQEIIKEDQSRTTAENLRNFLELSHCQDDPILLVTSDFHMGRALGLADQIGLSNVSGLPSSTPWTSWFNCALREALILGAQKLGIQPSNVSIGSKRL